MKKYKWVAESNDRSFEDESRQEFTSKEECYNDMRNAALEKMKWNTEYAHDFNDCESIEYGVTFCPERIIHASYSGVYTYEIKEIDSMKTFELTEEQIKTIVHALNTTIRVNQESVDNMYDVCGCNRDTNEIANRIIEGNVGMKTLINYLEA
jgi:hypothetical protein